MTEYEAASLALHEAALAIQKASLEAQQASVWVAALVGAAQCSLIAYGLYFMRQAARHRDARHRETMKALEGRQQTQNDQHRETMEAMERRHRENMAALTTRREAQKDQHRENMAVLEDQREALMELIRRTSAPPVQ